MYRKAISAVLIVGLAAGGGAARLTLADHSSAALPVASVGPVYQYPFGVPAVKPSRAVVDQSAAGLVQADVEQYLAAYPPFKPLGSGVVKLSKMLILPAAQVSAMLNGEWIGRPDDALVAYVEVSGPLSTADVSLPHGITIGPSAPKGILVFDAQTGNLLVESP